MIYQMKEPVHDGSGGPSLLLVLTSWGSLLKKGRLQGGNVAVAPVDVILPITKGQTARQPVASYSQVVETQRMIALLVFLKTGTCAVHDLTTAGTVFLLTKLWRLGGTRYKLVINCTFRPGIENRRNGNCLEGSGCGLSEAPSKRLRREAEENHKIFKENSLSSCQDSKQSILQYLIPLS